LEDVKDIVAYFKIPPNHTTVGTTKNHENLRIAGIQTYKGVWEFTIQNISDIYYKTTVD